MAEFGANVTNIGEVQNAVTAQGGVVDQSGEIILRGVGKALDLGVETYATIKTQQFAKDYEAVTQLGLGAEATTEEEKQFQDRLNRIDQTAKLGKVNTAKVLKEEFLRKSIAEKPWFAQRFEEMAGRIDNRYTDLVSAFQQAEAAAAVAQSEADKSAAASRKSQIKRLERVGEPLGHIPTDINGNPKPWETMTDSELQWNELQIQVKNNRMQVLKAARDDEEFRQGQVKFGQSNTTFNQGQVKFYEERQGVRSNELAADEVANAGVTISKSMNDWVKENPTATKEQLAMAGADYVSKAAQSVRSNLQILASQPGIKLSPTEIENYVKGVEENAQFYVDQITGPTSKGSVVAREYDLFEKQGGINAWKMLPIQKTLSKAGITFEPVGMANLQSVLGEDVGVSASNKNMRDIENLMRTLLENPESVYTPSGTSADVAVQAIATNILVDSFKTNSQAYFSLLKNPEAYIPLILPAAAAWEAEPNAKNKGIILDSLTNPAMLQALSKAHPNDQTQVYEAVKPILQSTMLRIFNPAKAPELIQSFDPKTGFVPVPDNKDAADYANAANSVYQRASMLEMQVKNDADPDRILRNYFGPKMAEKFMAPAEEQPQ